MSEQKHYLWLDLETTGLDPDQHGIIEIAAVLTTSNMKVLDVFDSFVHEPLMSGGWRWEAGALAMHAKNGLLEEWTTASTPDIQGLEQCWWDLECIMGRHFVKKPILAGSSVHFDRRFIRRYMPHLDSALHYRHLDVSAITEMMTAAGHEMPDAPPSDHRAMSDVRRTMALYEHWLSVAKQAHDDSDAKLRDTAQQLERLADHVRWRQFVLPADISFKLRKIAQEVAP